MPEHPQHEVSHQAMDQLIELASAMTDKDPRFAGIDILALVSQLAVIVPDPNRAKRANVASIQNTLHDIYVLGLTVAQSAEKNHISASMAQHNLRYTAVIDDAVNQITDIAPTPSASSEPGGSQFYDLAGDLISSHPDELADINADEIASVLAHTPKQKLAYYELALKERPSWQVKAKELGVQTERFVHQLNSLPVTLGQRIRANKGIEPPGRTRQSRKGARTKKRSNVADEIYEAFRVEISSGERPSDTHLPTIKQTCESWGVSKKPVQTAYSRLVSEGYAAKSGSSLPPRVLATRSQEPASNDNNSNRKGIL